MHVGPLSELPDVEQKRVLSIRINELVKESHTGIQSLFVPEEVVERLAQKIFLQIAEKERLDITARKDYHHVDTDSVKTKTEEKQERNGFATSKEKRSDARLVVLNTAGFLKYSPT